MLTRLSPWSAILRYKFLILVIGAVLFGALLAVEGRAFAAEKRMALVVGNAAYEQNPLETPANDAGLVAQTLQAAGFDVTGARDLDEDSLRHAFRDFAEKTAAAGPDAVAFVYFAGYGLQFEGENYLVPIGANITRDADIPSKATRVSDYVKSLAASGLKASVVVLDAARANPFTLSGAPLASGLALYEPGPRMILAYNAAPGTIAAAEKGPYGAYAHALSEMIREGGLSLSELFEKVRLRVNETTKGAQLPWNSGGFQSSFVFFERSANAPTLPDQTAAVRTKPIGELGPRDGYATAVQRDSMQGYEDFIAAYPRDPSAKRIRAIMAIRREAITWRRTRVADSPNAYWSYLRRYPRGPHVWDARRRLAELAAAYDPPPSFAMIDYDVPPPPPEEIIYVERPVFVFDDPEFDFAPPPPPPVYILPPPPPDFVVLPPPYVVEESYALPIPVFVPIPVWQHAPASIEPPPNNLIFENIHNQVIFEQVTNNVVVKDPGGQLISSTALKAAGMGAAAVAIGAALPSFVAKKANVAPPPGPPFGAQPLGQGQQGKPPIGQVPPQGPAASPAATLHTPPNASPLPTPGTQPLGQGQQGKPPIGQVPPQGPAASPAATLHTPPNASPLPTPGTQPLGQGQQGKPPIGQVPPQGPAASPAATLHTPPNASPLPTPGTQPLGQGQQGKPPIGQVPPQGPAASPAATLHTPPNASPLPTPGTQPLGQGLHGNAPVGSPPLHSAPAATAPGVNPPAGKAVGPVKALVPSLGQSPRQQNPALGHAPAINAPLQPAGRPQGHIRDAAPAAPVIRNQPPPAAVYHQPPPAAIHAPPPPVYRAPAPPPAAAYHQPPPAAIHAPPPPVYRAPAPPPAAAYHQPPPAAIHAPPPPVYRAPAPPPAAVYHQPPPAAMRAPAPAPAPAPRQAPPAQGTHCAIVNGVPVCK